MDYMDGYESCIEELKHSQGIWKDHQYTSKIVKNGHTYYMYNGQMNRSTPYNKGTYKSSVSKFGMVKKGRMSKPKEKEEEKKTVKKVAATGGTGSGKGRKAKAEKVAKEKTEKAAKGGSGGSGSKGSSGSSKAEKQKKILRDNKVHNVKYYNSDKISDETINKRLSEYDRKRRLKQLNDKLNKGRRKK